MTSLCDVTSDFYFVDLWLEEYVVLISREQQVFRNL